MLIALAVFLLAGKLFPPPPQPVKPKPGAAAPGKDAKDQAAPNAAAPAPDSKKLDQAEAPNPPRVPAAPGDLPGMSASPLPVQFVALGSVDPNSGYRMLVTLTNAGAAVVRAEMSSPRYRDQEDWNGYLGDLELKNVPGGVQVQVVGAGTPAANAKIEAGDVIVGVGNPQTKEIKRAADLTAALVGTKPDQEFTLQVRHGDKGPQPIVVRLMRRPFAVVRPEIENYRMREVEPPKDFVERPSFLLTLAELNGKPLSENDAKRLAAALEIGNWELTAHDEKSAVFRRALPELKLEIVKTYTLAAAPADQIGEADYPAYHLQLDIELHNTDGKSPQKVAYRLDGATGMSLEGWWYSRKISRASFFGGGSLRNVVVRCDGTGSTTEIENSKIAKGSADPIEGPALEYAGVDSQYFSAIFIPQLSALDDNWFLKTEGMIVGTAGDVKTAMYANPTCRLTRKAIDLPAGAAYSDSYHVFLGPKRPELLSQYYPKSAKWPGDPNYSLRDLIYFGWFGAVARIMLTILHFFYSIVGNYGLAIILLTVAVRGLMFPISYKQTKNMARIQALKPEMDRINEKYKTDLQKKSQATQELYRKHSINPLGGCLPLFLQMPIFIGLYRSLMVDVELRQSPLFTSAIRWCSNLAAPDMLWNWSAVMPTFVTQGILGPYLNVLPIVTVSIMLVTQKMSMPPPANEQAAMQQKMMKYMMVFFALMFYKVAAGLCLYLIVSSLWGIAERKLLPKNQLAGATPSGDSNSSGFGFGDKRPRGDGSNGSAGPKKPRKAKRKK
jgi:YidC/Oxa1 family membrane protein insertase